MLLFLWIMFTRFFGWELRGEGGSNVLSNLLFIIKLDNFNAVWKPWNFMKSEICV